MPLPTLPSSSLTRALRSPCVFNPLFSRAVAKDGRGEIQAMSAAAYFWAIGGWELDMHLASTLRKREIWSGRRTAFHNLLPLSAAEVYARVQSDSSGPSSLDGHRTAATEVAGRAGYGCRRTPLLAVSAPCCRTGPSREGQRGDAHALAPRFEAWACMCSPAPFGGRFL